jgi:hypothetical protein
METVTLIVIIAVVALAIYGVRLMSKPDAMLPKEAMNMEVNADGMLFARPTPADPRELHIIPSEDCMWNGTCRIPPNNDSFFAYEPALSKEAQTSNLQLVCNQSDDIGSCPCQKKLGNCTNILYDQKCFTNNSCPCQAVNYGGRRTTARCIAGPLGKNLP